MNLTMMRIRAERISEITIRIETYELCNESNGIFDLVLENLRNDLKREMEGLQSAYADDRS